MNPNQIVASTVTESSEQGPPQVSALLCQVDRAIRHVIGDGIYDQAPVCAAVDAYSPEASVIIPLRKDAVLSPTDETSPPQRDQHLSKIEEASRFVQQSRASTASVVTWKVEWQYPVCGVSL